MRFLKRGYCRRRYVKAKRKFVIISLVSCVSMNEPVATFSYDLNALRLEYKTTCDALRNWPGGDPSEQDFLECKKQEIFRALAEQSLQLTA
mgnify:CR=1 FL=1